MAVTLIPSYGRDYKNGKEVQEAWDSGKDFTICDFSHPDNGRQINIADVEGKGGTFNIRYKKLTQVKVIKMSETLDTGVQDSWPIGASVKLIVGGKAVKFDTVVNLIIKSNKITLCLSSHPSIYLTQADWKLLGWRKHW